MNPDIQNCVNVLKNDGAMLYPTDTIWGLGCNVNSPKAIAKILAIKRIANARSMIALIDSIERLEDCIEYVPLVTYDLLEAMDKPLTIVFPKAKGALKNIAAEDGSVGIRIAKHPFCQELIQALNSPIVSTSANHTGEPSPINFQSINPEIIKQVDFIVAAKYDQLSEVKASRIIKIDESGMFQVLRD
ncbi:MAG: threonylcarbamoyl-AMP synthase [Bacteroidales bacterium]|jgi:L-threonylcarbamoyladenylate synthase|nr:threonylcarbamoyl-AMP synthase [Bacteroidales bacterium]